MAVVVVAPDSFKGTATAAEAARAIAEGWRSVRPGDEVIESPMADGGEGTLDAFAVAVPGAIRHEVVVCGPAPGVDRVVTAWLELPVSVARPHRVGVVELADAAGILRVRRPDPLHAHTRGLGEVIRAAVDAGVDELLIGLGGSCSTDGGAGALRALGARLTDDVGRRLPEGGGALRLLARIDTADLIAPPRGGARLLTDVDNPLLGPRGAAVVFGPQKGASSEDVHLLESGLSTWARVLGGGVASDSGDGRSGNLNTPGAGAAGGTAFGLSHWGARIASGGQAVANVVGLADLVSRADVVITGEGRFDEQTAGGKAPAVVAQLAAAARARTIVIAGAIDARSSDTHLISLTSLAGSSRQAMSETLFWLRRGGALAARESGWGS